MDFGFMAYCNLGYGNQLYRFLTVDKSKRVRVALLFFLKYILFF